MVFSSTSEADFAFAQKIIDLHAKIKVRLPEGRKLRTEDGNAKPGAIIETTYGRILFNSILPPGMDFYNQSLKSSDLARDQRLLSAIGSTSNDSFIGRYEPTRFPRIDPKRSLFGTDDLVTPESKTKIIADADKKVMNFQKNYLKGLITPEERYNQVLDTWTHARELITKTCFKPWSTMIIVAIGTSTSVLDVVLGARGGIEQIRQLRGMRGLMAKPTGEIIEAPIKANFREGLSVLEYFSSTHGARKGLADTALFEDC